MVEGGVGMRRKRTITANRVAVEKRVYRTVKVKKTILQCERPYIAFGKTIRARRKKIGMTQQELADILTYVRTSIVNIEAGRQRILLGDVIDFAKALRMKPLDLFRACFGP